MSESEGGKSKYGTSESEGGKSRGGLGTKVWTSEDMKGMWGGSSV